MKPQKNIELPKTRAAAAAKSLQSCPTLCDPTDGSPPGSPIPGILQARTLGWVAISFLLSTNGPTPAFPLQTLPTCMLSCFSRVRLCATP